MSIKFVQAISSSPKNTIGLPGCACRRCHCVVSLMAFNVMTHTHTSEAVLYRKVFRDCTQSKWVAVVSRHFLAALSPFLVRKESQWLAVLRKVMSNSQRDLQSCEACALGTLLGRSSKIA